MRISTQGFFQTGLQGILQQQSQLNKTQLQLSTGRRINNPSDDPAGAARLQGLERAVAQQEVFQNNITRARQRLQLSEQSLGDTGSLIQRVRELTVQASNDTLAADQRAMIASEIRQRLEQLVNIANSQDGSGEFLFAGTRSTDQPFLRVGGQVSYQGDSRPREITVAEGATLTESLTGDTVFMRVRDGNGVVRAEPAAGNTGSGVIRLGGQVDMALYDGDTYRIQFNGPEPDDYEVLDSDDNVVASGTYQADQTISFAGIELSLRGTPAIGDEFTVEPARNQPIFQTLQSLADALGGPQSTESQQAVKRQAINDALGQFDRFENQLLTLRAELGGRLVTLDDVEDRQGELKLSLQTLASEVRDLDYVEAISRFQLEQTALQAAQQSFLRVQQLSLFNFL